MALDSGSPNVVLITVDALRADYLGFMDSNMGFSTPTIDKFAEKSLSFQTAYANAPHTRASFPAIMTGTYPWMYGGYESIADERPFIAECFSEAGYQTAGFHSNPYLSGEFNYDRGFDIFRSGKQTTSLLTRCRRFATKRFFGDRKDTLLYKLLEKSYSLAASATGRELGLPYMTAEELNRMVADWLGTQPKPAFLWLHYMDVHDPYTPHKNTVSEGISNRQAVKLQKKLSINPSQVTVEDRENLKRLYRGEIKYLDRCLETILNALDQILGRENTIVAFLADHGEAFGEHGYYRHPHEFHQELVRIPFLLRGNNIKSTTASTAVSTVDLLPTLLDSASIPIPEGCEGNSLFGSKFREANQRFVFGQTGSREAGKVMTTDGDWKLIIDIDSDERKLYNLREDPQEHNDVTDDHPNVADRLKKELNEHLELVDARNNGTLHEYEISSDIEERLEQLGYK